jgi:hypothetical protein
MGRSSQFNTLGLLIFGQNSQRRFPPGAPVSSYIYYKSPNIVYGANNILVDAQLSIQYFKNMLLDVDTNLGHEFFHSLVRPHVYYLLVYGTGHQKMMVGWSEKNKK